MANPLAGVFPAVWTPTDCVGNLLVPELRANLTFLKRHGVNGFMALGSTGEFPLLELVTRKQLLEEVIAAAGSLPVLANISDARHWIVADLGRFARQIGARAVAVLPPYFYHVAQCDLVEFFLRAADASELPLVLYNFPERTGIRIELETIAAVAERIPLAAVKQSGNDFAYHTALVGLGQEKRFVVFTGADTRFGEALELGAAGTISGIANAVPELLVQIFTGDMADAAEEARLASKRLEMIEPILNTLWFPLNIAALMAARGLRTGEPKEVVSAVSHQRYLEVMGDFERLFREWKLA